MAQTRKTITVLSVFYLLTRLIFLARYPIFNDEAIYLRYAWVMTHVPRQLWYSLSDSGKQPLLYWLYGLSWQVIHNPLLGGRLVSVFIGLTTVWAVCLLGGWTAGILFITAPLFVFFDRLALVDSALAALFAWLLVLLMKLEKRRAIRIAILAGILVGISFWIKSTGIIFCIIAILALARFSFRAILSFIGTVCVIIFPLVLRPESIRIFEMAHEYTYTMHELIGVHFVNVWGNLINTVFVYVGYISPLIFGAAFLRKKNFLFFAWVFSIAFVVVFGRSVHGRYVLFTAIPMIILASTWLAKHKAFLYITMGSMTFLSAILVVDSPNFFYLFPQWMVFRTESWQYVDGWPSGYGVKEALNAIDADRRGERALVAVRWDSGNPEDAMFVYTKENTEVTTKYLDPRLPDDAREVLTASAHGRVYFVTRQGQYNGFERYLIPLAQFPKPGGKEKVELFRVRI
jgi:hypothetical protein